MDYKEKYEQALERARDSFNYPDFPGFIRADVVFPELKESEDEKVRKWLIEMVEEVRKANPTNAEHNGNYSEAIAWLEKQGKQKPKDKPKFKVGDWITNGACTIQITSVDDTYYWHDNDCVGGDIESMDKEYHFWTIQDAKDGDVLANDNSIIIFRSIGNYRWNDAINYYVAYKHNLDKIVIQHDDSYYGTVNTITFEHATKEQIDLLSQKMKEAGYEWDAEKKELKKIEQKLAWSEEDEKERKRVVGLLEGWLSTFKETCYAEDCKCGIAWLKTLKERMKGE